MYAQGIGLSDPGRVRTANEDALLVDNDLGLYIVCDGMGGHAAGEVASSLAVEVASRTVNESRGLIERARAGEDVFDDLARAAEDALHAASNAVYTRATTDHDLAGMGTTMTLLLVAGSKAIVAHVGDTRLYLLRGTQVHQLSNDHTLVAELLKKGQLDEENVKRTPFAHVLSRAIGTQESVAVDALQIDVLAGDTFVLCTDGLHDHLVSPDRLLELVGDRVEDAPASLVGFANESGGADNITVVLVHVEADEGERTSLDQLDADVHARLEALASTFLFQDLSLAQLSRVLEIAELVAVEAGGTLAREGDRCSCMYVVLDGRVAVTRNGAPAGELARGNLAGATTLLNPRPARATLHANGDAHLLRIDGAAFRSLVQRRPFLGVILLAQLGQRLGRMLDGAGDGSLVLGPADLL